MVTIPRRGQLSLRRRKVGFREPRNEAQRVLRGALRDMGAPKPQTRSHARTKLTFTTPKRRGAPRTANPKNFLELSGALRLMGRPEDLAILEILAILAAL